MKNEDCAPLSNIEPSIYIIIPIHNRKSLSLRCISRLKACNLSARYKIVVIDDGSTDGSKEAIAELHPEVHLLTGNGSLWWTGAIKTGMEYAYLQGCQAIIWLNDDCLIQHNTLSALIEFIEHNPRSVVGGLGLESDSLSTISFGGKRRKWLKYKLISDIEEGIISCDLLSGNLVCIPAEVISDIGYPDPQKCPHYGGDSLFLIRARKAGYSIFLDTRKPAINITGEGRSKMNSGAWLTGESSVIDIFKLIFMHQSVISWRIWWFLFIEEYSLFGVLPFLLKMLQTISMLCIIAILRLLPQSLRIKISITKRRLSKALTSV